MVAGLTSGESRQCASLAHGLGLLLQCAVAVKSSHCAPAFLPAAAFTAQGIYSPNNNTAGRRAQMAVYLENTTQAVAGVSLQCTCLAH